MITEKGKIEKIENRGKLWLIHINGKTISTFDKPPYKEGQDAELEYEEKEYNGKTYLNLKKEAKQKTLTNIPTKQPFNNRNDDLIAKCSATRGICDVFPSLIEGEELDYEDKVQRLRQLISETEKWLKTGNWK